MKRKWRPLGLMRFCLAATAALLFFACSNEPSGPPTPPPPPPFQPQTVVVQLGERGGATTLISTSSGGWTRNGQPFTTGSTVTGENAASYRLTLTNGVWTAEFIPPDPEPLVLGTSGDAILLQAQENGSYLLDGEPVTAGRVVEADNGNQYRLVLGSDGAWTVEFVPPAPQLVYLGSTGQALQVGRLEDGGFTIDGQTFAAGEVVEAQNGNRYTLTLGPTGLWTAVYVEPDPQVLRLGSSGDPPLLVYRQENGTFRLNGEPLLGGTVVEATNGSSYRLILGSGGVWQATYIPENVTVQLGSFGGTVILTPNEDGSWQRGSFLFSSGDTVRGTNGFEYRLTLGDDGWIVEPLPMTVNVPVTGSDTTIALARLEDGSFLYDNRPVDSGDRITSGENTYTLNFSNNRWTAVFLQGEILVSLGTEGDSLTLIKKADGTYEYNGVRVRNGTLVRSPTTRTRYRLRFSNGEWTASLYVPPIPGGGTTTPVDPTPVVSEDILSALPDEFLNEDGTFNSTAVAANPIRTRVGSVSDDFSAFRGGGQYEDDTFVESVIRAIDRILAPIEARGLADGGDSELFVARVLIESNWGSVQTALNAIFGITGETLLSATAPVRSGQIDVIDTVSTLEDLREDLSDVAKFKSRFKTQIDAAVLVNSGATGDKIYEATRRVAALGATANTRFGVISTLTDPTNSAAVASVGATGTYTSTAFAFSPLEATQLSNLPSRGTARYSGRTWAIDSSQMLYSGAIELLASIAIGQVNGKVSNLRRSDNSADWTYNGKDVREIMLPAINNDQFHATDGSFTQATADATVVFEQFCCTNITAVPSSAFEGQFVGGSDNRSPGAAVIGTWRIGVADAANTLNGSFGAEHVGTSAATLPSTSSGVIYANSVTGHTASIDTTELTIGSGTDHVYTLSGLSTRTTTVSDKTVTLRLRNTSLTRFGAWKQVDSSGVGDPVTTRGVFMYSQLAETSYPGGSNYIPRRGSAQYAGRTVAVDSDGDLYDGSYRLSVTWSATTGAISAAISGLSGFTIGGKAVTQIGFQDTLDAVTSSPAFSGAPDSATVQYTTSAQAVTLPGAANPAHNGVFLDNSGPDGPYAVVGSWSLTDPDNTSYTIDGAFGADLVRAP
ncbi:MAG: hypothetical protein OXH83_06455 [Bryobacterales bacterium]|nr:hypothetical protein [Bryobacterales bacterium]